MKRILLAGTAVGVLSACATSSEDPVMGGVPIAAEQTAIEAAAVEPAAVPVPANILLADWTGSYDGVPPWDQVRPALFPEALQFSIDEQRREMHAIANNGVAPTFANTIEAMEKGGQRLGRVLSIFGVMTDNLSTPEYQALYHLPEN